VKAATPGGQRDLSLTPHRSILTWTATPAVDRLTRRIGIVGAAEFSVHARETGEPRLPGANRRLMTA
jgi:hypothetical protein